MKQITVIALDAVIYHIVECVSTADIYLAISYNVIHRLSSKDTPMPMFSHVLFTFRIKFIDSINN